MELLDAHCHLLGKKILRQIDDLRSKWEDTGITHIINVCSTLHESQKSMQLFKDLPEVIMGIGKHPWKAKNVTSEEMDSFERLISLHDCKVIGEVGLDYYAIKDVTRYGFQQEWFKFFIEMSNKYKKPLNIHVTGAEVDILKYLTDYWDKTASVNIHWYSGPIDVLTKLLDLGCYFSINPAIYYSKSHQDALQKLPIDRVLTETDGDVFYKPMNILGEPSIVTIVLDKISELKNINKSELAESVILNFKEYMSE